MSSKQRALIVDDSQTDRLIVKAILRKMNFDMIHETENAVHAQGKFANAAAMKQPYSLIILDWNMPGGNGLKLISFIRRHERFLQSKIIVMTATSSGEVVKEAMGAGANDFIVKPVSFQVLQEKILKLG